MGKNREEDGSKRRTTWGDVVKSAGQALFANAVLKEMKSGLSDPIISAGLSEVAESIGSKKKE